MIADDFLTAARAAITEGDHQAAAEYMDAARDGIRAARIEAVKATAKAVIDDLQRIQHAERLCRYAVSSGRATPAAIQLIRELEGAPRLDTKKSLFGPQNLAAFDWHRCNRSEIFDLIAQAAEEASEGRSII
jgi:hypothetical protein